MDRQQRHREKVKELTHQLGRLSLPAIAGEDCLVFDYNDRYTLKNRDVEKCVFCLDSRLSKQYEKLLMRMAQRIYPQSVRFFTEMDETAEEN